MFLLTIVFAFAYGILYPSLWFYKGTLGWTSTGQWEQQVALALREHPPAPKATPNPAEDLEKLSKDKALVAAGQEIFSDNCAVCHGEHGEGKIGPNLHGPVFVFGGDSFTLLTTIREGRRGPNGLVMPTWKKFFENEDILKVAAYVYTLRYDRKYPNNDQWYKTHKAPGTGPQANAAAAPHDATSPAPDGPSTASAVPQIDASGTQP
jgi:cytochrome c oxidase cbb3-type subunit 3